MVSKYSQTWLLIRWYELAFDITISFQVEAANTLAKIVLSNPYTQEELTKYKSFSIAHVLDLMRIKDLDIRLRAANALATFAYNSIDQQLGIRSCGGVMMSSFESFIDSDNETYQAYGAFQIIILARVIVDVDQVINHSINLSINQSINHSIIQSFSLISHSS